MNDKAIVQQGEPPRYDVNLGSTGKQMGRLIRQRVLEGAYPPDTVAEMNMIRNFKLSKLSVAEYLAINYPSGSDQSEVEAEAEPVE